MINNREVKRFNLKFGKYLDPLGLFLLIAIFVLPSLAVINLSPKSKALNNVLGAQSKQELSIVLVGGVHDFLKDESLDFPSQGFTKFNGKLIKRELGEYSKPILQITNSFDKESYLVINGGTETPTGSPISIMYNEKEYVLQKESGETEIVRIKIPKASKNIMYLKFDTNISVKFNENLSLSIVQE